jgi:succinyl-diaminopimelate desuccinylase
LESIDAEEAADLTASLVAIRSYPGEERAVQEAVAAWLRANGIAAEERATEDANRPNIVARIENGPGPVLLLNGHTDTVLAAEGWSSDPWTPRRDGDRLYGLGACDMKSGVAAAMLATRALDRHRDRWRGTVIFTSVVDEEAYSIGARALIDQGITADACLVTESSWAHPALGAVGKVLIKVEVTGKAAHATMPWEGINAAVEAARFTAALDQIAIGQHPRIVASQCVLSLLSGSAQYVITVPEKATILINRHLVPSETAESALAQYRELAGGLNSPASFDLGIAPPYYPSWEIGVDHPLVETVAAAYAAETGAPPEWGYIGFGDANLFSDAGIPTVQIGAHGANFHAADEWVDVPSIAAAARVLLRTAEVILA